jgi:branched-chain amino acid aminotransferase
LISIDKLLSQSRFSRGGFFYETKGATLLFIMTKFKYENGIAFMRDSFVPFKEATISIASSPVLYGLAVYTVFSINWNDKEKKLYAFRLKDHYARLVNSARIMGLDSFTKKWPYEKFEKTMLELVRKNDIKEDALVRISIFIDAVIAGTKITGLPVALSAFIYPLGRILNPKGIKVCVSSWRHNPDDVIPNRAKVNGAYVSNCLMKNEALQNGYDDAISLDHSGHVTEGTVANLFLVRNGKIITPSVSSDILEGITRNSIMIMARDLKIPVEERQVDRTELYIADEAFICGSSARVVPIISIDKRPIGTVNIAGKVGPIASNLAEKYLAAQKGMTKEYKEWRTEVK